MLLNFDLAGAEFVVVAYLCRDESMLDIVRTKKSPHVVTANRMFGVSEDLIKAEEERHKEELRKGRVLNPEAISAIRQELKISGTFLPRTNSLRQAAKSNVHAGNYRIGYREFALHNEIDEREAKRFIELYTHAYPALPKWWNTTDAEMRKTRRLTNCFGRTVYFMGMMEAETFKKGYAFIPQSTVADSCIKAMVSGFEDSSADFVAAQLLAQVHDSLLYQYPAIDFAAMARFARKVGCDYMRPVLSYHGADFQLDTDLKAGFDWAALHEVKSFMTLTEEQLAEKLREIYETKHPSRIAA